METKATKPPVKAAIPKPVTPSPKLPVSAPAADEQQLSATAISPCAPPCASVVTTCLSGRCPSFVDQGLVLVRMCQGDIDRITCLAHNSGAVSFCTSIFVDVPDVKVPVCGGRSVSCVGQCQIPIEFLVDCPPFTGCSATSAIASNFNGTPIAAGNYIWFTSVFQPPTVVADQVIEIAGQTITFTDGKVSYSIPVPNSEITVHPSSSIVPPSVTFDTVNNRWLIVTRSGLAGTTFASGVAFLVPAGGLSGGINPVTWTATFSSNASFSFNWQWAAAVYTSFPATFPSGYNLLNVKPIDDNILPFPFNNSDHAGTPETYKAFVIGGARGGGGSNYTGSYSATSSVSCTASCTV
jgi:hypothetical protein